MKFAILFVLCFSICAVTCVCPWCGQRDARRGPARIFDDPNTSSKDIKDYFVDYVNKMTNISPDVLRGQSIKRLAAVAIDELNRRLAAQPDQADLIKNHLKYFMEYRDSPVPPAPFVDLNKDLSRVSPAQLKDYLVGYLHALTDISEYELSLRENSTLIDYALTTLRHRFETSNDPEQTETIRHHYNYFMRLQQLVGR